MIAVIAAACRLPGAPSAAAYWDLLSAGRSAIGDAPPARGLGSWRGGFLESVDTFDAGFFGISPREAACLDPQQRLALELGWEVAEDAQLPAELLRGTRTGVFIGGMSGDYAAVTSAHPAGPHTLNGITRSMVANRLSHFFGLHGPSLLIDSGQSSSLVAVHLACESIRRGECDMAIAGGVQLNLIESGFTAARELGALSPDGRCYPFDSRAQGYVRGEGGALVLLKPLHRATADGDRVRWVVMGGAVAAGTGGALTVPSQAAQERVLRQAYEEASVDPAEVQYVESHGTGTRVGDPVEAAALGAVLGRAPGRTEPLLVGSAKPNIGHLEAAAGVAGLVRAGLSLEHSQVPPTLNFASPPPEIPLGALGLAVPAELAAWPRPGQPALAGVSSFGMGGTNCHLVLAAAPPVAERQADRTGPGAVPWVISAAAKDSVRAQAARLADFVADRVDDPLDTALALAARRTALRHRAVVVAEGRDGLVAGLRALAAGDARGDDSFAIRQGQVTEGKLAYLFPGQGAQRLGMGKALHAAFPVFAAAFDEVCAAADPYLRRPLREIIWSEPELLGHTSHAQVAIFAVEVAVYRLLESWGVIPDLVAGHSVGEIAAAHVAGLLPLSDAAGFAVARGALMARLPAGGGMIAIRATEQEAREALAGQEHRAGIAALNGPSSVVVAGDQAAISQIGERFRARGRRVQPLKVSHAFHSPLMDPVLADLREAAAGLRFERHGGIGYASGVTGGIAPLDVMANADYWVRHARQPVRFGESVRALHQAGARVFLEVGPGRALTAMARENVSAAGSVFLSAPAVGDTAEMLMSLACLHLHGRGVNWDRVLGAGRRRVSLPTYAFQRDRHWAGETTPQAAPVREPQPRVHELTAAAVLGVVSDVLGYRDPAALPLDVPFNDLGVDSPLAVALTERLSAVTGLDLPATTLFSYPTTGQLVAYACGQREQPGTPGPLAQAADEPIAIVGMSCRYPGGVKSPADLWRLVANGRDAITEFPADRGWDIDPARLATRSGGFIDDPFGFDPEFFGISPREATAMDPQQRVLLELAWEAFERYGLDVRGLRGEAAGVFVGAMHQDYGPPLHEGRDENAGYLLTGKSVSVAAGRISYAFGFEGPAITVDTACSSSLVAMHLAAASLRAGECTLALAGGVTIMSSPGMFTEFSAQHGLAADGRCKAFAAAADGTAWAEGAGIVVLERLPDALRHGHQVLALVSGSATNQDGASNGLTAPSGRSQERLISRALERAGVAAADVDAVEAHGTGTALGDPIEARALLSAYCTSRPPDRPLWLGSLKSNIGHAQAAAGVGGVIKMVQALRHRVLPATLHVDAPSPHVDWTSGRLALLTEQRAWPAAGRPRRAAVSSFGISGTNAHVILEEAPRAAAAAGTAQPASIAWQGPAVFPLSARTKDALRALARELADVVRNDHASRLGDVAATLARRPVHPGPRAVIVADDRAELAACLDALGQGSPRPGLVEGTPSGGGVVFVFPGQGSQWPGMAAELLETWPPFAAELRRCAAAIDALTGWSLLEVLTEAAGSPSLARVDVVQPALFAIMVSLAAAWRAMGVEPAAVVGHSQGEIAAACVAGALSLEDAALIVVRRSEALASLSGSGAMASVALGEAEARDILRRWDGSLDIAVINGPASVVVAGQAEAVAEFLTHCAAAGIDARRVDVDYASHTKAVEPVRDSLLRGLREVSPRPARVPLYSTLTGDLLDTMVMDGEYWYANLRGTVRFEQATRALYAAGSTTFIEVSPHPVLVAPIQATVPAQAANTLARGKGGPRQLALAAAAAFTAGAAVDWRGLAQGQAHVDLPTYQFSRRRYALAAAPRQADGRPGHPVIDGVTDLPHSGELLLTGRASVRELPWLTDHQVDGTVLLPGTAVLEMAGYAARAAGHGQVTELVLHHPVELPADGAPVRFQLALSAADPAGVRALTMHSRLEVASAPWAVTATGSVGPGATLSAPPLDTWPPAGAQPVPLGDFYDRLASAGYQYGPDFRGVRALWSRAGDWFAEIAAPAGGTGFGVHPALLDAALHPLVGGAPGRLLVPYAFSDTTLTAAPQAAFRAWLSPCGPDRWSITFYDASGTPVARMGEVTLRPLRAAGLYGVDWRELPAPPPGAGEELAVVGTDGLGLAAPRYGDLSALPDPVPGQVVTVLEAPDAAFPAAAATVAERALAMAKEWIGNERFGSSRLVFVTRDALAVNREDAVAGFAAAGAWGLARSAMSENPGRFALLDIGPGRPDAGVIGAALAARQPELAIKDHRVYQPALAARDRFPLAPPARSPLWRLDVTRRGSLEHLALIPCPEAGRDLRPGEVRVAVRAAGVNFRDLTIALAMLPGERHMGGEGAGVVSEVGPGVTALSVGDKVMGLFDKAFGPTAIAVGRALVPMPADWSFAQAASVPIAFLTAYQCLTEVARLKPGESVLVHAAAGGVGMAAVQIARHLGAEVFGTASPRKQAASGLDDAHFASSRSLDFGDRFLARTGGRGIDVILNSLAGDYIDASLGLLAPGGRFVEIGKTDLRDPAMAPGIEYTVYNLLDTPPERVGQLLTELLGLFRSGTLTRLPQLEWDVRRAPEALKTLRDAAHVGKIVLTVPRDQADRGTVVITGGTGTLGGITARHLVARHGVRRLLLASRSGPDAPDAARLAADLTALGADVTVAACDVSDRDSVARLLAGRRVSGVVHAAGILDDGTLATLTAGRVASVLRPKADGAWHLHELTRDQELEFFLLFSSASGILGEPGQANYAAANALLDALAQHRHAAGLPATSLAWGIWAAESGMTGHLGERDLARLTRTGMRPMSTSSALALLDAALSGNEPLLVPAELDERVIAAGPGAQLRDQRTPAPAPGKAANGAGPGEQPVLDLVLSHVATVLGHTDAGAVPFDVMFKDLGFDSLTGIELRNRLKEATGLPLPATLTSDHPTPRVLAEYLSGELAGSA